MTVNENSTAAHHLIASPNCPIRTIYSMVTKHLQNGSSKGISTLNFEGGHCAGKTYEDTILAAVEEQNLPTVPVPVFLSIGTPLHGFFKKHSG